MTFVFISVNYFAAVLRYDFAEESEAFKFFVIYVQGLMILALSVYLGYRETYNAIQYFSPLQTKLDYLKATAMIAWHIAYYGPTYWIVIHSMIGIDYQSQLS